MELDYSMIGKRIARRRRELGLTQQKVSELIDISTPYLSNIERAVSIPSTEVIMRLADALDTTPDEFLVGSSHRESEEWKSVAQELRELNTMQLKLLRGIIRLLKEQEY